MLSFGSLLSSWLRFTTRRSTARALAGLVLFGSLLSLGSNPLKATEPATSPAKKELRFIQEFWALSTTEKQTPTPFRFECDVTLYDPEWRQLWVQDASAAAYVLSGPHPLPIHAGQHIIVSGLLPPGNDLDFENASITVVSEAIAPPIPANERLDNTQALGNHLVSLDAIVDRQVDTSPGRQQLYLCVDGRLVFAWARYKPNTVPPDLRNCLVRITGVYSPKRDSQGNLTVLELQISDLSTARLLHPLASDPRFELPNTPIKELAFIPNNTLVRINGRVVAQDPGHSLQIRDASGQVELVSTQTLPCAINDEVQAIGYPHIDGTEWRLEKATYRPLPAQIASEVPAEATQIRMAAQIRELAPEKAARGIPVELSGVITWSDANSPFLFIQDSSGGICVFKGTDKHVLFPPGRNVEVQGTTSMGNFAPVVIASNISKIGDILLPEAKPILIEHALTGIEEAQWVEMRGFVRSITHSAPWTHIELATATGSFNALLRKTDRLPDLTHCIVRIRGVCNAETNERRQLSGIRLWVPDPSFIQMEDLASKHPFDIPTSPLSSLGQFNVLHSASHRVKVSGVVLHQVPGRYINLQEGHECLELLTRETTPLAPGDRIEAVGFIGHQNRQLVLKEVMYRKTAAEPPPAPTPLPRPLTLRPGLHGHLVIADAILIDATSVGNHTRMTLQYDKSFFEAVLETELPPPLAKACENGSTLRLTGIYELRTDEHGQASHFFLQLRSPSDVTVLTPAPWLTQARVLALAGALAVFGFLVAGWVILLRRQIHRQLTQIRHQISREAQLQDELQRATRLESLGILAGGIAHDFNNLLTVVMGNISIALLDEDLRADSSAGLRDAAKAIARAKDLTHQLLTFAKGGSPVRSAVDLPDVIREVTQFALHGSTVRCDFDIPDRLWPADVDKGQISQVVQNIVINAVQAMPDGGTLNISLRNQEVLVNDQMLRPGRYLQLTISDTGTGISPDHLPRIFDPYFTTKKQGTGIGLATVYSIIRKHLGHISVDSTLGKGSCFRIWLPATETNPAAADTKQEEQLPSLKGRILVMDDEESIRRLCLSMLLRLGLEAMAVPDGSNALQEYENALKAKHPYDLVILDLTVPGGMGGLQTLQELQRLNPGVKAIVSSGYSSDATLGTYASRGFVGIVSKPYEIQDLARTLASLLPGRTLV